MKMKLKASVLGMMLVLGSYAPIGGAVDYCTGQSSIGNPFDCGSYGNCTWWAAKKAKDKWGISWSQLPATSTPRHAMYWDDQAINKPTLYQVSTTPAANTIGVIEANRPGAGSYGHVAWIESVSGGNVTFTQMDYFGTYGTGVSTKTKPASYFSSYIYRKGTVTPPVVNYDGQNPSTTGCDRDGQTVAYKYITGGKIELRWSNTCKTNWARVVPNSSSARTSATVRRSSDGRSYSYSGTGSIWSPMVSSSGIQSCASGTISGVSGSGACR